MTPNKLPPLPEFTTDEMCTTFFVEAFGTDWTQFTQAERDNWRRAMNRTLAEHLPALRQSQSLPAGAVAGLASAASAVSQFLRGKQWGDYRYMEGTEVYGDLRDYADAIDSALAALHADAREKGEAVAEWETVTPNREHSHIRCAKYPDLMAYHEGVAGDGPHAYNWSDKPHRLVYDLTAMVSELRDRLATQPAQASEAQEDAVAAHAQRAFKNCIRELRQLQDEAKDFDFDEMTVQALQTGIESIELRLATSSQETASE